MSDDFTKSHCEAYYCAFVIRELCKFARLSILAVSMAVISFLLPGCAGNPPHPLPFAQAEANRSNERGVEAARRGDMSAAVSAFDEAYRGYAAVEHYPGMVTALLNTARVSTGRGNFAAARKALQKAQNVIGFVPSLTAEFSFEQAKLLLREGKASEALAWGERALTSASEAAKGRMTNLLADIVYRLGNRERAVSLAANGLTLSKRAGDRQETANALRLLAELALKGGEMTMAESRFTEALSIDKELAAGSKIAFDLQGLARTAEKAGEREKAVVFWGRAANVSMAGADRACAVASLERIAEIHEQAGDTASLLKVRTLIADIIKNAQ